MEISLDKDSLHRLAHVLAPLIAKELKRKENDEERWITTHEAATMLGISDGHLRKTKDRYPHIKNGEHKQGELRFLQSAILKSYAK